MKKKPWYAILVTAVAWFAVLKIEFHFKPRVAELERTQPSAECTRKRQQIRDFTPMCTEDQRAYQACLKHYSTDELINNHHLCHAEDEERTICFGQLWRITKESLKVCGDN